MYVVTQELGSRQEEEGDLPCVGLKQFGSLLRSIGFDVRTSAQHSSGRVPLAIAGESVNADRSSHY